MLEIVWKLSSSACGRHPERCGMRRPLARMRRANAPTTFGPAGRKSPPAGHSAEKHEAEKPQVGDNGAGRTSGGGGENAARKERRRAHEGPAGPRVDFIPRYAAAQMAPRPSGRHSNGRSVAGRTRGPAAAAAARPKNAAGGQKSTGHVEAGSARFHLARKRRRRGPPESRRAPPMGLAKN